jgi:hypothetical protein
MMAKDNHRRGQLERKVKAQQRQQAKFDAQTNRLIRSLKIKRVK